MRGHLQMPHCRLDHRWLLSLARSYQYQSLLGVSCRGEASVSGVPPSAKALAKSWQRASREFTRSTFDPEWECSQWRKAEHVAVAAGSPQSGWRHGRRGLWHGGCQDVA